MSKPWLPAISLSVGLLLCACAQDEPGPDAQVLQRGQLERPLKTVSGGFAGLVELDAPCEDGALTLRVFDADGSALYSRRYELTDPDWHDTGRGRARYFALTEADRELHAPAEPRAPFELFAIYDPRGLLEAPESARQGRLAVQPGERSILLSIPGALSERAR